MSTKPNNCGACNTDHTVNNSCPELDKCKHCGTAHFVDDFCPTVDKEESTMKELSNFVDVLSDFVRTIDDTGGIFIDKDGYNVPVADRDWIDLGSAYISACGILNRKPKLVGDPEDEFDQFPDEPNIEIDGLVVDKPFGGYDVSIEGKFIGNTDSRGKAAEMLRDWMNRNKISHNCWFIFDHGNPVRIDVFEKE